MTDQYTDFIDSLPEVSDENVSKTWVLYSGYYISLPETIPVCKPKLEINGNLTPFWKEMKKRFGHLFTEVGDIDDGYLLFNLPGNWKTCFDMYSPNGDLIV